MTCRIVFDLDGTLIDSAPDIQAIANRLLADFGREELSLKETHNFIGNGVGVFVEKMRTARGVPESQHSALVSRFIASYDEAVTLTRPYRGVRSCLEHLAEHHRLGICTNKPRAPAVTVLRHLELDHFFGTVWGGDNIIARKPDPAPLLAAFAELGPEGPAIYVGDSEVDAETARRAGIPFFLFTEGYRKTAVDEIPHAYAFQNFSQLFEKIAQDS